MVMYVCLKVPGIPSTDTYTTYTYTLYKMDFLCNNSAIFTTYDFAIYHKNLAVLFLTEDVAIQIMV